MGFVIRLLVTAVAVAAAAWLVPGIEVVGGNSAWVPILVFSLVFSLVNIAIKPVLQILSLPITVLTLGLFYLIINTAMLYLASWLTGNMFEMGLAIGSFGSAFVASIVISIVSAIVNAVVGKD